ncbi:MULTISPECIES: bifunctional demethylmenaquinone methyltransferase/2-methoxy-6-polyprenyl-1,4-benzoquinol methylase UbiE [unclassified Prochlorococcus]|uniref:bifunctional demethylmenaquinone methyltransferase/2-methoxy-6-polyprenyl-1,4-benzoquinol methylase UbiE n=1 Tax=unclassified Prochlorococcus TaxID=2627481 RepID=UPI0005337932|nr:MULTISPECIES: bifunctional demethylmenaquinone methyltransferase/2-methoxy-6-polyprenyl-1,4-benzoquinol methylase UbiE [unclassified Prochlorococcus]KGG16530.1 2-heptaprenyl-1,4-naphthoquinone methyltransferase [Prochlorococcus sp. MIT 0602]KGG16994.1 2-heptaprenyl-1,4-naphthoquinone methyltransferase [Prochlorococcus sp. MIT 0603]
MKPRDPKAIQSLFDSIAKKYDLLNDLFSFGRHRSWKRQLVTYLKPSSGEQWVDLCCGTGDLTLSLARLVRPFGSVLGIDFSGSQILQATKRALAEPWLPVSWLKRDVLNTGLPSACFDGVVMSYGLRNLSDPEDGLQEIYRLLKPGAKAGILDFSRPVEGSKTAIIQKLYLRSLVVPIASLIGLREEYAYLEKSLQTFPAGQLLEEVARKIGFQETSYKLIANGQMGILLLKT